MKLVILVSGRVSYGSRIFWERVINRILIRAEEMKISPKQFIENLFDEKDSEAWISTLQALDK